MGRSRIRWDRRRSVLLLERRRVGGLPWVYPGQVPRLGTRSSGLAQSYGPQRPSHGETGRAWAQGWRETRRTTLRFSKDPGGLPHARTLAPRGSPFLLWLLW